MFNIPIERTPKKPDIHPWQRSIKAHYAERIKRAHNSIRNMTYPKPKEKKKPCPNRVTFTVIGNRQTREFIYCVKLVQGIHTYIWNKYDSPIIRGCTAVEWDEILRNLKLEYGGLAHCLEAQVAVLCDNKLIGGEKELKEMIESKYIYHLVLNYQKESDNIFSTYLKSSGRPCAYMHISIDKEPIGSLLFMLYSEMVPITCENFLCLCKTKKGGYSGTPIHRVVKGGWIQGGGFGLKNINMDCENFIVPHNKRGVLGMANAGRHIECSTQFYVLLDPNEWLKSRFVAFGQLIDGEETLKKIEEVETYYEAPTVNITIYSAGVVNLDCQDIRIHKGALEYLDGHVEDLVTIGELFYEMLMEHLFLEIEFRRIQKMDMEAEGEGYGDAFNEVVDADGNIIRKNISATRRYIRKKEASKEDKFVDGFNRRKGGIEQQFDVMRVDASQSKFKYAKSGSSKHENKSNENENDVNNDFDVESYECEPEEYKYLQVTPTLSGIPKEKRPYYIPFTDVPYPGEVDSTFDLKRMLQGDYCLESDLDPKQTKLEMVAKGGGLEEKVNAISGIISSYGGMRSEESFSSETLSSEEEQDILDYLSVYGEKVSFSGKIVRHIAKKYMKLNPVEDTGQKECFTDDDLRMMRMALKDFKSREHKKVSINVQPWATSTQIKRRQTGFAKPEDMAAIRVFQRDTDFEEEKEESESDEEKKYAEELEERQQKPRRTVSIVPGPTSAVSRQIVRRPTGYFPSEVIQRTLQDSQEEDEEASELDLRKVSIDAGALKMEAQPISRKQTGYYSRDDFKTQHDEPKETGKKSLVRIMSSRSKTSPSPSPKTTTSHFHLEPTSRQSMMRQSVLVRLLEDVADDDGDDTGPKLKDYKPHKTGKKPVKLAMSDTDINETSLLRKSTRLLRRVSEAESNEALKRIPSSHIYNKSVMTMDHVGHELLPALRGTTRSKLRPTMTVTQYQQMNEERRKEENILQATKSDKDMELEKAQGSKMSLEHT